MENTYENNYIKSIDKGLRNSISMIDSKITNSNVFFDTVVKFLKNTEKNNGNIYFFGNGASASFSNHMALDWSKNGGILSFSLSDSSMLTALANDYSYDEAFVEFKHFPSSKIDSESIFLKKYYIITIQKKKIQSVLISI